MFCFKGIKYRSKFINLHAKNVYYSMSKNIKLKKGKDKFWFGNITAGVSAIEGLLNNTSDTDVDNQSLYLFQPKLFYYSPKYTVNVIGDLNNIGELAFTRRDYYNFSGNIGWRSTWKNVD